MIFAYMMFGGGGGGGDGVIFSMDVYHMINNRIPTLGFWANNRSNESCNHSLFVALELVGRCKQSQDPEAFQG